MMKKQSTLLAWPGPGRHLSRHGTSGARGAWRLT